jgi:hypothetical protein
VSIRLGGEDHIALPLSVRGMVETLGASSLGSRTTRRGSEIPFLATNC